MTQLESQKIGGNSNEENGVAANTAEQPINPLYQKGQERLDKLKENISKAKSTIGGWLSKGASFFSKSVDKGLLVAASSPEIGRAATDAAAEKVEQFSTAVETKIENAVNAVETKYKEAQQWVGDKKQEAFNWTNDKKEQVVQFGKDTVEISAAIAMVAAETASEKYTEVKESVKSKIVETKEKIQSKWEKLLDFGKAAIAAAEAKRQSLIESARKKMNEIRMAKLLEKLSADLALEQSRIAAASMSKEQAEAAILAANQQLEASNKRAAELKEKIAFQQSLFNPSLMAA